MTDGKALEVRGQVGDYRLVILNFDESGFELETPASSSASESSTQAAGEPLASAVTVADATVPGSELGTTRIQSSVEPVEEMIAEVERVKRGQSSAPASTPVKAP
ncbi:MAG: hypothetical protein ACF8AM_24095 [Rhodopirellula sp. JB055]|uniref:hypothetical protein n=1 Tax=Rhodopirellula sp. JB055 TaxID=3342846 RepID=UPI00370B40A2